jgi:hypothetical protein
MIRGHERRHIGGARHRIVHVRAGDELAVRVIHNMLHQRLADALDEAAVHLAFDQHWIDDRAEVVGASCSSATAAW